jgi:hypothetical protein
MSRIAGILALPLLSAGIAGGLALGLAGTANAAATVDSNVTIVTAPDTYAAPAATVIPWAQWVETPDVVVGAPDVTVVQTPGVVTVVSGDVAVPN